MRQLLSKIKCKKGMTLVETSVTFIIAAILIAATSGMLIFGMNMYKDATARGLDNQIGDSILDYTTQRLIYADKITPYDNYAAANVSGYDLIYIAAENGTTQPKGYLHYKNDGGSGKMIFPKEFYNGTQVRITYTVEGTNNPVPITVKVELFNGEERVYQRSKSMNLLNVASGSVQAGTYYSEATKGLVLQIIPGEDF